MSLVNQVLNDLEKRGVNVTQADASIRAVPPRRQTNWMPYVLTVLMLLVVAVAGKWYVEREEVNAVAPVVATTVAQYELVPGISDAAAVSEPAISAVVAETAAEQPVLPPADRSNRSSRGSASRMQDVPPPAMPVKVISPQQLAESEFSKANQAVQDGRIDDALVGYKAALLSDPTHKASRRAWVGLLLGLRRNDEAERVLQRGLRLDPHDASFAMLLARLQVERNALPLAVETLQKNLPDAADQADYQAFMAALLQRQERHQEAVAFYQKALALAPDNGVWLMGMGLSLQAMQQKDEARAAYQRALGTNSLNPQLQQFVQQKLKEL